MSNAPETGLLDISNADHHALRALSNSGMKDLAVSQLRYWYRWVNPAPKEEEEETAAQRMGSALHCAVLESEERFESRYARALDSSDWPVCLDTVQEIRAWVLDKGGKCSGVRKDDVIASAQEHMKKISESVPFLQLEEAKFLAQNSGKTILKGEEWERLTGMASALSEEPALRPILAKGKAEQSMVAKDPETGVMLKIRVDWLAPKFNLDMKTFVTKRGASIDKSVHDAIFYEGYYRQSYFYDYVRRLVTGEKLGDFESIIAFVESEQPHETRIKRLLPKRGGSPNLFWETARIECQSMIRLYAECLDKYGDSPWREPRTIETLSDEDVRQFAY